MVQAKRGNRSAKSKKLHIKRYRQKKKSIWQDKYYNKLSEDSLKNSYSGILIEEQLPIGILESNNDETEELSSSGKEKVSHIQCTTCIDNLNEPIEYIYGIEGNVPPPMFAPILVPVEESLPSHLPSQSQHSDFVPILQCKEEVLKARAEHNDALLMENIIETWLKTVKKNYNI